MYFESFDLKMTLQVQTQSGIEEWLTKGFMIVWWWLIDNTNNNWNGLNIIHQKNKAVDRGIIHYLQ